MNLTSVARTKDYLSITTSGSDAVMGQLIARASDQIIRWCARPFQRTSYSSVRLNGTGTTRMRMSDDPIISFSSLQIDNSIIPVSADAIAAGYQFDEKYVYLFGGSSFPMGYRNVLVSYVAGFTGAQTAFIPATPGPYTIIPSSLGYAMVDRGVTSVSTGLPFALVGSAPSTGQYAFSEGVYTFASADQGVQVTMSFDYAPGSVEQAAIEIIGTKIKQRDNLGVNSKSLRDESISYSDRDMSKSVQGMLAPYRKIVPV